MEIVRRFPPKKEIYNYYVFSAREERIPLTGGPTVVETKLIELSRSPDSNPPHRDIRSPLLSLSLSFSVRYPSVIPVKTNRHVLRLTNRDGSWRGVKTRESWPCISHSERRVPERLIDSVPNIVTDFSKYRDEFLSLVSSSTLDHIVIYDLR